MFTSTNNEWVIHPELSVEPGVGTFPFTQLLYSRVVDEFNEFRLTLAEPVLKLPESS